MICAEPVNLDLNCMAKILRIRPEDAHKGTMGHALLVAGSYGMAGCASLAAEACLRSGAGKLTLHTIRKNRVIMQMSVPEAILRLDSGKEYLLASIQDLSPYQSVGIGPGMGTKALNCLSSYLEKSELPMVLDADALNMLAQNPALLRKRNYILVIKKNNSVIWRFKTCNNAEKGSFSAARRTKKRKELSRLNSKVDVIQGNKVAESFGYMINGNLTSFHSSNLNLIMIVLADILQSRA